MRDLRTLNIVPGVRWSIVAFAAKLFLFLFLVGCGTSGRSSQQDVQILDEINMSEYRHQQELNRQQARQQAEENAEQAKKNAEMIAKTQCLAAGGDWSSISGSCYFRP